MTTDKQIIDRLEQGFAGTIDHAALHERLAALAERQGPVFRATFASSVMGNFADHAHAVELAGFAPAQATAAGRIAAARAEEAILIAADFRADGLPAIDAAIAERLKK